jgi:hypothetical protein
METLAELLKVDTIAKIKMAIGLDVSDSLI